MSDGSSSPNLLPLKLNNWRATRDALHEAALVLGTIRGFLAPLEPHWGHVSLRVVNDGLTTTPLPIAAGQAEIRLNFQSNHIEFVHLQGTAMTISLAGQSQQVLAEWLSNQLKPLHPALTTQKYPTWKNTVSAFDPAASAHFGQVLTEIATALEVTRLHVPGRTSELQLWPHHFDLAFLWFSGRKVPDKDPTDLDTSDEQVNIGFVTGDDSLAEAYFYITVYPEPPGLDHLAWPAPGRWYDKNWHGVVANYADFAGRSDGVSAVKKWLTATHQLMREQVLSAKIK